MKKFSFFLLYLGLAIGLAACTTSRKSVEISEQEQEIFGIQSDTEEEITIADEESNYELIIMDLGFNRWLRSVAYPRGHYPQEFLERRNRFYVTEWNNRVIMPTVYDPVLYELLITYDPNIDYGYEVNYLLYNYFIFFQRKYKQRLGPFLPRI